MITPDGFFDWMEYRPGPADKCYTERNSVELFIPHSMVGRLNGWYSRLFDLTKVNGRYTPNAAASVHGSVLLNGHAIQHYSVFTSCWASGWRTQNCKGVAFEHESEYTNGKPDESKPFTPAQVATGKRIIEDLRDFKKRQGIAWVPSRPPADDKLNPNHTLYTHNECVKIWGGGATACESGRAAPLWAIINAPQVQEDGYMKETEWVTAGVYGQDKTYVVGVCASKPYMRRFHVDSAKTEDALRAAKLITRTAPVKITQAQLDLYVEG